MTNTANHQKLGQRIELLVQGLASIRWSRESGWIPAKPAWTTSVPSIPEGRGVTS
jgi:hypothetical protein